MFGKSKDGNEPTLSAVKQAVEDQPANGQVSAISRGITVVGRIFGEGTVEVFGRIEGKLSASAISIYEGARVEGDLVAEDLIIAGEVKGTIHADRVRLNSTAVVEGDIFHHALSIEENAHFDGSSKRQDKAVDVASIQLGTPAAQDRDDEAIDLPRIPLRAPVVRARARLEADVGVIEDEPTSDGSLARAKSPSLAPH
jgi:cytoskeletal protein CcmA (bactofilin family)